MNEFSLVEFFAAADDVEELKTRLYNLGDDLEIIDYNSEYETEEGMFYGFLRISGRINTATASVVRLSDPFLSDRMRISYIPNELKDKYRK